MADPRKVESLSVTQPVSALNISDTIDICHSKVTKAILLQIFQYFDRQTLRAASEVCKSFNELSKHPSLWNNAVYSGPHSQLPELLKAIPFPPPAVLQTTLPAETRVIPAPQYSTILPEYTKILLPVLPETVPLIAQVPDVVASSEPKERGQEKAEKSVKEVVEISQVLPGYAPSYAGDYVPNEVNNHSFSTFANTISFNVSRYHTPAEITESKDYKEPSKETGAKQGMQEMDTRPRGSRTADVSRPEQHSVVTTLDRNNIEYVPAEYFRGVQAAKLIQSVSVSKSVTNVKPEVLASGRILTHMTPIPSTLTVTSSTMGDTIVSTSLPMTENGHSNNGTREPQVNSNE